MPDFIALADEILEEELARQAAEALRLLRETPVLLFSKAQQRRHERKKMKKANAGPILPSWFLGDNQEEVKAIPEVQAAAQHSVIDEVKNEGQKNVRQQTMILQKRTAKIICGMAPKRARGAVRIKRR